MLDMQPAINTPKHLMTTEFHTRGFEILWSPNANDLISANSQAELL